MQTRLAEVIREAIRESGRSAGHLGAASGVDKAIITRFLRAERTITVETAEKLLAALGCAVALRISLEELRTRASERAPWSQPDSLGVTFGSDEAIRIAIDTLKAPLAEMKKIRSHPAPRVYIHPRHRPVALPTAKPIFKP